MKWNLYLCESAKILIKCKNCFKKVNNYFNHGHAIPCQSSTVYGKKSVTCIYTYASQIYKLTGKNLCFYQCQDVCWWMRNAQCPSGSCSHDRECAGVFVHHGISWPDQSQWCRPGCLSFPSPSESYQASHLCEWSSWSGCTQCGWSEECKVDKKKKTLKVVLLQLTIFYSSTWFFLIIPSDQPTAGQSSGWTSWSRNWRDPPYWGRATPSPSRYNLLLHHTTL